MLNQAFQNRSSAFTRGLGLLLVAFIFYGTTIEATHRHGQIVPPNKTASVVEPNSSDGSFKTTTGCSVCLICQLHQNFAATLLTVKPHAQQLTRYTPHSSSDPLSIHSISSSPASGRAPPQAN